MALTEYRKKRRFSRSPEPSGTRGRRDRGDGPVFVVQKHDASSLHYDFRIEVNGVLKSWAVPKGPSTDPKEKRLARPTEDHPLDYAEFEGVIPEGEYGGGTVLVWDHGTFANTGDASLADGIERGKIRIDLDGEKLRGGYALTRFRDDNWLLIKTTDEHADPRHDPVASEPESALTGRDLREIADDERG